MGDTFVVVGGDAAGMSAASKAKRDDPDLDVVAFERGDWVSYGACGMPYYVKGDVDALDDLVEVTPRAFVEERNIDLRTNHEVTAIDRDAGTVRVDGEDGSFDQPFDTLLIATGAAAMVPPFDGLDLEGVFTIQTMDSARAIYEYLHPEATASFEREGYGAGSAVTDYADTAAPESVAVIGGGYIGIEMAEAFEANGLDVHLFEMLPHVLAPFGEAAASIVESHLVERGVDLHLETAVTGFDGTDRIEAVRTDAGEFPVDMALVGVGVEPRVELAVGAGLDLGTTGAIRTDEYGRTNDDRVFAAGDCAENHHVVTDDPAYVPLALTANRAGRAIGATVAGSPMRAGSIAGTAIVKAFDLEVSRTGLIDHDEARAEGFDPVSKTITDSSRAGYYPGTEDITVTLCADRESHRVLGASIVGRDQAGKRIDAVATALHAELTVLELQNLDLAYAPPFGPVWDPVLTAARVLGGALDGSP